jgi:hypothetical protein
MSDIQKILEEIQTRTKSSTYLTKIVESYDTDSQITGNNVIFTPDPTSSKPSPTRAVGKVRDRYDLGDKLALVTTDRQSGFDRMLAVVPFKVGFLVHTVFQCFLLSIIGGHNICFNTFLSYESYEGPSVKLDKCVLV